MIELETSEKGLVIFEPDGFELRLDRAEPSGLFLGARRARLPAVFLSVSCYFASGSPFKTRTFGSFAAAFSKVTSSSAPDPR